MANYKGPTEGGSGGRRGHSGMEHFVYSHELKESSRKQRRIDDKESQDSYELDGWSSHDLLWLRLSRAIHRLNHPGLLPWETEDSAVLEAWSMICHPSQIPFLEQRISQKLNPTAELLTKVALKIATKKP